MKPKNIYLIIAIFGFILPNIFVFQVSIETGNWLFWLDPKATTEGMFGNKISTAFIIDLLIAVFVFFIWSYQVAQKFNIKNVWMYWILTMLFGIAGPFPLFLYRIEKAKEDTKLDAEN